MSDQLLRRASEQQSTLDSRALEIAVEAKAIIQNHERTCDADRIERRNQAREFEKAFVAMNDRLSASKAEISKLITRGLVWMIGILATCMGYFLITFGLPGAHH